MRLPLTPFAFAAGLLIWMVHPTIAAEEVPSKAAGPPQSLTWPSLLKISSLPREDRRLLEKLAAFLDVETWLALDSQQRKNLLRYARARLDGESLIFRCWSPETPTAILLAYHAVEEAAREEHPGAGDDDGQAPQKANQFFRRWGNTATNGGGQNVQGRPITLTWSIVPDGTAIPGDSTIGDSDDPSNLIAWLNGLYGSVAGPPSSQPWFPILRDVFDDVAAKTGIHYVYEENDDGQTLSNSFPGVLGERGDIRLGGHDIDGTGTTLAYNYFPDRGDMIIDTSDDWFDNRSNTSIRLANTMAHEHGHGLGLEHVCPLDDTKLMEPFINTNFRGMQFDDVFTLQRHYGDFYEQHDSVRNNDTLANAAALPVAQGTPFAFEWLSIDDNNDLDYYSFEALANSTVTVRIRPSTRAYLEGSQNSNGSCSSGSPFDPGANHNLGFTLYDPDQSTVLQSVNANPAGQQEELVSFVLPNTGTHYLRVTGGSANLAQLYRLEVEVTSPSVSIALNASSILTESYSAPNGLIDPGETVEFEVVLQNNGSLEATDVEASLSGPAAFTGFTTVQDYGTLGPSASAARKFVFGLTGDCGETVDLDLTIASSQAGFMTTVPVRFVLGPVATLFDESFDASGHLPPGWISGANGSGSGWSISTSRADSPPNSLFADDIDGVGLSSLTSPAVTLGPAGANLIFRHFYNTEASATQGFDGGVLEVSINEGAWQDILAAGANFTEGGYVLLQSTNFNNPLPGRNSWAGNSGAFITTMVDLPASFAGDSVRFRWRMGHDSSVGDEGWYLDSVKVTTNLCGSTAPLVTLSLEDGSASEFIPLDLGQLTLTTELPPVADLPISLLNTGNAIVGLDATGLDNIVLPAGQKSVQVLIQGVNDSEIEGDENLVLKIDPASGIVAAGPPEVSVTITDTPYGRWASAALGLGTANGPLDDFEGDGSLNIEEYAWQTDATSRSSLAELNPRVEGGFFRIDAPFASLPGDLGLTAETSTDLENWTADGIQWLADGFQVPADVPERYLRLVYRLIPAAP